MTSQQPCNFATLTKNRKTMRTANNNYTVEGLVAKYRNFVKENCPKRKDFDSEGMFIYPDNNWAEPQLLTTLYKISANTRADNRVLKILSKHAEDYQKLYSNALTEDELSFLIEHFSDVSSYMFSIREQWYSRNPGFDYDHKVECAIINKYIKPEAGNCVYLPNTEGYFDIASIFQNCEVSGFTDDSDDEGWALGQIRLFAAGVKSEIVWLDRDKKDTYTLPDKESIDYVICENIFLNDNSKDYKSYFDLLKTNGCMLMFAGPNDMIGDKKLSEFKEWIIKEMAVSSLISFREMAVSSFKKYHRFASDYILLVINKKNNEKINIISSDKQVFVDANELTSKCLWPSHYLTERPTKGIPLSYISCFKENKRIMDLVDFKRMNRRREIIIPDWISNLSYIAEPDLSSDFKDSNLSNKELLKYSDLTDTDKYFASEINPPFVMLSGNKRLKVGYIDGASEEKFTSILPCLSPINGIDVKYLAAILLSSEVSEQILSCCEDGTISSYLEYCLDYIIVPDHDEKEQHQFLINSFEQALLATKTEMNDKIENKVSSMKADYINEVRMRKHDMRPHLRQIASSERLMIHYIDNINEIEELKVHLKKQIANSQTALKSISELVDHLSDEEKFGIPEHVDLIKFFEDYDRKYGANGEFEIRFTYEKNTNLESIRETRRHSIDIDADIEQNMNDKFPLLINIAPVDLNRIVVNIVENAKRHGFTDENRKDYFLSVDVGTDDNGNMYQIDFCNNGNPLPAGITKERFGIRGEKAGINAGTGSGGYIVKTIVEHYGGDYDIFSKEGITTIRIKLPKIL